MKTTIDLSNRFVEMVASSAMSDPYWIDGIEIVGEEKGWYYSEHLANGGTIKIHDLEENEWHTITNEQFVAAIGKYIQALYVDETLSGYLDDATAEMVLQIACFGDVIYG